MQSQADAANRFTWVFVDAWHVFRSRAARNSPFVGFGVASLEALDSRINHRVLRGEFWLLEEGYWVSSHLAWEASGAGNTCVARSHFALCGTPQFLSGFLAIFRSGRVFFFFFF